MSNAIASLMVHIGANVSEFIQGMAGATESLTSTGKKMREVGKDLSAKLTAPIAGLAAVAGKTAIDFESAFAGVRKTVNATEGQYADLEKQIRRMALTIPAGASAIAGVTEAAGQLGIERKNLLSFSRVMVDLGESTNLSADQAATSLARLANITQMPQTEFDRLGSSVVALGNNLATTEAEIVEMGLRLAGAGSQVGMTEAEILGFSAALSSVGIAAEAGGTAFSVVFKDIYSAVKTGNSSLKTFASVSGMTVAEFKQQFEKDAAGAMVKFVEGLGKIGASGGNTIAVLEELKLSDIRVSDALLRASGAGDLFRKSIEISSGAWKDNTALTKEAAERYKTMASQLQITRNHLTEAALIVGRDLMPMIKDASDAVRGMAARFSELDAGTRKAILVTAGLVAAVGPLLVIFGSMATGVGAIIGLMAKVAPLFAAGGAGATAMAAAVNGLGVALRFLLGPAGLALTAITAITAATVKANQAMQTVLDNQAATYEKTGKAVSDATAIYAKFAKTGKVSAEEAKQGAIGLRLLATEAANPAMKKSLLEKATALQKVVDASKKTAKAVTTDFNNLAANVPPAVTDAVDGAGKAATKLKEKVEQPVKAAELSFQGLYASFRRIDTEAKALGTGAIEVMRQKIGALESQIKDAIAFTGPMTKAQEDAFAAAVASLARYRGELSAAEEAQRDLGKETKKTVGPLESFRQSTTDIMQAVQGLREGLKTMTEFLGIKVDDTVLAVAGSLGNFALAGVQVWTSLGTLIPQLYSMGMAMHASLGPVGLVTAGLAALAVGAAALWNHFDKSGEAVAKSKAAAEEVRKVWADKIRKIGDTIESGFGSSIADSLKRFFSGEKVNFYEDLRKGVREAIVNGMVQALVEGALIKGQLKDLMDKLAQAVAAGNTALVDATIGEIRGRLPKLTSDLQDAATKLKGVLDFNLPTTENPAGGKPDLTPIAPLLPEPGKIVIPTTAADLADLTKIPMDSLPDLKGIKGLNPANMPTGFPRFATGGLVTGPTMGVIGEGMDDEAVLPLNDSTFDRLGSAIANAMGNRGGGQTVHVQVTIHAGASVVDESSLDAFARAIGIRLNTMRMQAI